MTEQTIIPPMPQHIALTRRVEADMRQAAQHAAANEERLSKELTDLETWAKDETQRIQDDLEDARKKAEKELKEVTARLGACQAAMAQAGRDKAAFEYEAREAHGSIEDWCVRAGIAPAALPPLPQPEQPSTMTGPMPAVQAQQGVQALLQAGQAAATPPAGTTMPDPGGDPAPEAGFHGPEDTDVASA